MQLMTHALGGEVAPAPHREFGLATIHVAAGRAAVRVGARPSCACGRATATSSRRAPPGFQVTATSANAPVAAMVATERRLYALLFHPEVAHTDHGLDILRNFAYDVCGCTGDWTMSSFVQEATERIREQVGRRPGGLRPERRRRFDRRGAADPPGDRRSPDVHLRRQRRDAAGRSGADPASASSGCSCRWSSPTRRRCFSIGWPASPIPSRSARSSAPRSSTCSRAKRRSSASFDFLGQGTLYPDVIESVSVIGPSHVIKSHHNVGGLPERMRFKLVEPLRQLFKDEVRLVGKELGLDDEFVWRQPFPGPGSRCGSSARSPPSRLEPGAPRRSHRRRGSEARGLVPDGCGSRSRCCCRCRASA